MMMIQPYTVPDLLRDWGFNLPSGFLNPQVLIDPLWFSRKYSAAPSGFTTNRAFAIYYSSVQSRDLDIEAGIKNDLCPWPTSLCSLHHRSPMAQCHKF